MKKEMLFCLRQYANDHIKTVIEFFRLILDMTAKGQLVDVNGLKKLGAGRIFQNSRFTGVGYARSHNAGHIGMDYTTLYR